MAMADRIQIRVSTHGAELKSLSRAGKEYLWNANPAFWGRTAPILFPIVGQVADGKYRVGGKEYALSQHGFARDAEFEPCGENAFRLVQEAPSEKYPYPFQLQVQYETLPEGVNCRWSVKNIGTAPMYFQIGAHPAFLLPEYSPEDPVHGYFECYNEEGEVINPLAFTCIDGGLRSPYPVPKPLGERIPITEETFLGDALLIEGSQVTACALLDKAGKKVLTVESPMAQAFGLWAPHKPGCPFVCIEPWCGITDRKGFSGDIAERDLIHRLEPGAAFEFSYKVILA